MGRRFEYMKIQVTVGQLKLIVAVKVREQKDTWKLFEFLKNVTHDYMQAREWEYMHLISLDEYKKYHLKLDTTYL